jgi:hypothetical protein
MNRNPCWFSLAAEKVIAASERDGKTKQIDRIEISIE